MRVTPSKSEQVTPVKKLKPCCSSRSRNWRDGLANFSPRAAIVVERIDFEPALVDAHRSHGVAAPDDLVQQIGQLRLPQRRRLVHGRCLAALAQLAIELTADLAAARRQLCHADEFC